MSQRRPWPKRCHSSKSPSPRMLFDASCGNCCNGAGGRRARSRRNDRHTLNDYEYLCNTSGLHNMSRSGPGLDMTPKAKLAFDPKLFLGKVGKGRSIAEY